MNKFWFLRCWLLVNFHFPFSVESSQGSHLESPEKFTRQNSSTAAHHNQSDLRIFKNIHPPPPPSGGSAGDASGPSESSEKIAQNLEDAEKICIATTTRSGGKAESCESLDNTGSRETAEQEKVCGREKTLTENIHIILDFKMVKTNSF